MTFFGPDLRNGLPIGLGSVAGFGIAPRFSPASLFLGGTVQGAWFDPSDATTLFSDRAGTTPCGTPGGGSVVPVGLMLDKSQGLVLGPELVTAPYSGAVSGGFSITSTSVVRDGVTAGGTASLTLSTTLTANAFYQVTFTAAGLSGDNTIIRVGTTADFYRITAAGTYTIYLPAGGTSAILRIAPFGGGAGGITLTNISVKAIAGNHAIAANDTTARPELRARVNLLTYSEQFDNAAWFKNNITVSANAAVAPDGTTTADKVIPTAANVQHSTFNTPAASTTSGVVYAASVYVKAAEYNFVAIVNNTIGAYTASVCIDLTTGAQSNAGASGTYLVTSVGNGWWRVTVTATATSTSGYLEVHPRATAGAANTAFAGDGTSGVLVWGAQLTATNEFPANTYQRIVDANTYDAVGFPRYLVANGTSSAMSTPGNVNLSGTDKVAVFAGVRKNDNTNVNQLVEFSSDVTANAGAFSMPTNPSATGQWATYLRGSTGFVSAIASGTAAPITTVNTALYDIALSADEARLRINGTQVATSGASSAGAGNFGSYPLFIGARNNASLFFNGNIYSLIVVGSAVSAGQISATEQWVAGKTGITL